MFHPALFAVPTGPHQATDLADLTTQLDAAGVVGSRLLIAPDDRIFITVDSGADFLATLLVLDLEPVDSAGPDRYAKGTWRGMHVVAAHITRYNEPGLRAS